MTVKERSVVCAGMGAMAAGKRGGKGDGGKDKWMRPCFVCHVCARARVNQKSCVCGFPPEYF